jgi:glycerophosphoryl diester phosphodiesterase
MPSKPLLLGHRGARALKSIPENTLESFDHALADGCDGFEFDVRLTSDGVAVVRHDPRLGSLEISSATAQQFPALPLLRDVLELYQAIAFVDVELKVPGLEKVTLDLLEQFPPRRGFVVSSFLPGLLLKVHAADRRIPVGVICETKVELEQWRELPVQYVIPHHKLLSLKGLNQMKAAGRKVLVWTVNGAKDMTRFAEWGVDGIISDDTRLLALTLKK